MKHEPKLSTVLTIKNGEIKPLFDPQTMIEKLRQVNYDKYVMQCRRSGIEPLSYKKVIEILGSDF